VTERKPVNVLFLCTGNSARSILGEAVLQRLGNAEVQAFSAGSHPTGHVNPYTIELLNELGYATDALQSKSWDEFSEADSPAMDYVITVCSNAAGEVCPVWPGHPMKAHWDISDPAGVEGARKEKRRAFLAAYHDIEQRVADLLEKIHENRLGAVT
jgi:arsenate reductase (thioredoxin)